MRYSYCVLTAASILLACPAYGGNVSIMPSLIEATIERGRDQTTLVQIIYSKDGPEDTAPLRIALSEEQWDMDRIGQVSFSPQPADRNPHDPRIVFSPSELEIRPGETMEVRLSIIVSDSTVAGEYRSALIAEPRIPYKPLEQGERRLQMRLRLSTILYVEVPRIEHDVELAGLRVDRVEGQWNVIPEFRNNGNGHTRIFDWLELYPLTGDDRGEAIYSKEMDESGVVLPGRTREIHEKLLVELPPGDFLLVYRADGGRDSPLMEGELSFTNFGDAPEADTIDVDDQPEEAPETKPVIIAGVRDRLSDGYWVQLFATDDYERAHDFAEAIDPSFKETVSLHYDEPHYKVLVGGYSTRTEAQDLRVRVAASGFQEAWIVRTSELNSPSR